MQHTMSARKSAIEQVLLQLRQERGADGQEVEKGPCLRMPGRRASALSFSAALMSLKTSLKPCCRRQCSLQRHAFTAGCHVYRKVKLLCGMTGVLAFYLQHHAHRC